MIPPFDGERIELGTQPWPFAHPDLWPLDHVYVLRFWLPHVGPTVYVAAQLALLHGEGGQYYPPEEMAYAVGLSQSTNRLRAVISRSCSLGWATVHLRRDDAVWEWSFFDRAQTLQSWRIRRLPPVEQVVHQLTVAARLPA